MAINLLEQEVIARYLAGASLRQIAAALNISPSTVRQYLDKPQVREYLKEVVKDMQFRVLDFKRRAFDGAEGALEKLINLSEKGNTEELQRLASLDVVKISGLMPRKRLLVETSQSHGIDDDTKEWFASVLREARGAGAAPDIVDEILP